MFSASVKTIARKSTSDENVSICIQVIIDSKKFQESLKIKWPAKKYDPVKEELKARSKNDPDLTAYRAIVQNAKTKANEIIKFYLLTEQNLDIALFKEEWHRGNSKTSFLRYFASEALKRLERGEIQPRTYQKHIGTLNALKSFREEIKFKDLTPALLIDFENRQKAAGNCVNTIGVHHKNIKTYLNRAMKEKITGENPYKEHKVRKAPAQLTALSKKEFLRMEALLSSGKLSNNQEEVLKLFLFACVTGLRISDLLRARHEWVYDGRLVFTSTKNAKTHPKEINIFLTQRARRFIVSGTGLFFPSFSEGHINRELKKIAVLAGIRKRVACHVGRHTFISLMIELTNGNIPVVQELAGHSKIETTMGYVTISDSHKKESICKLDEL